MGVLGSLGTCNQSISFCKPRELVCFSKCGKINQACDGASVTYFDNTLTTISPNGFVTINNEDNPTGCYMTVTITDATGVHPTVTVYGGETVTVGVAGLVSVAVACAGGTSATSRCVGEWAFEGTYEATAFAY